MNSESANAGCASKRLSDSAGKYNGCRIENEGQLIEVGVDLMSKEEDCVSFCNNKTHIEYIVNLIGSHKSIKLLTNKEPQCDSPIDVESKGQSSSSGTPLDALLKREREFNEKHPCTLTYINVASFNKDCIKLKKIYQEEGLNVSDIKCKELEEEEIKGGTITLPTDRIINQHLFGSVVKDCYSGRRSITFKRKPEIQNLVTHADQYLQTVKGKAKHETKVDVSSASRTQDLFEKLFSLHNDVVLGELHQDISPKKAIIDSLPVLKKHNAAIAFEHLPYEPYQELLDQYMKSQSAPMPARLKVYLQALDEGHSVGVNHQNDELGEKYNYTGIVTAAKAAGVRVIAIETESSYATGMGKDTGAEGTDRYKVMNYLDKLVTDRERKGRKILHFVGSAHTNTREGVLGVAELMDNAPSIVISDSNQENRIIQRNVDQGDQGIKADFHILEPSSTLGAHLPTHE